MISILFLFCCIALPSFASQKPSPRVPEYKKTEYDRGYLKSTLSEIYLGYEISLVRTDADVTSKCLHAYRYTLAMLHLNKKYSSSGVKKVSKKYRQVLLPAACSAKQEVSVVQPAKKMTVPPILTMLKKENELLPSPETCTEQKKFEWAVKNNKPSIVESLCEKNISPDTYLAEFNEPAVMYAVKNGYDEVFGVLLDYKANPHVVDGSNRTIFSYIEENPNMGLMIQLCKHGLDSFLDS